LVSGLAVDGKGTDEALGLAVQADKTSPHQVSGSVRLDRSQATLTAEIHVKDLPLQPLDAVLKKKLFGLSAAKGSLDGTVQMALDSLLGRFDLGVAITEFALQHPAWDRTPWEGLTARASLQGEFDLPARRLDLKDGRVGVLGLDLDVASHLPLAGPPKGDFSLATRAENRLSCASVWQAQPAPFKRVLKGLSVEGELAFRLAIAFDSSNWDQTQLVWEMPSICKVKSEPQALARLYPILSQPSQPPPPGTKLPLGKFHPDFVKLALLPPYVPNAFITSEDSKFFRHNGFDLEMMRLALAQDLASHSFSRGASTITQQLAKNLFLSHQRTLARKLEEAIFAWRLHRLLSKDRILELYLNIIELGPGIQGLRQASRTYFGKDPELLTPLEAAHLAALTPNPHILAKRFRYGQVDEGWRQRLIDLLGMMKRTRRLTTEELAKARTSTLNLRPLDQTARRRP
jgi:penicillin-binding protein 1A